MPVIKVIQVDNFRSEGVRRGWKTRRLNIAKEASKPFNVAA